MSNGISGDMVRIMALFSDHCTEKEINVALDSVDLDSDEKLLVQAFLLVRKAEYDLASKSIERLLESDNGAIRITAQTLERKILRERDKSDRELVDDDSN